MAPQLPATLQQGDSWQFLVPPVVVSPTVTVSAAAGYTLKLSLRGAQLLDLTAAPNTADASGRWVIGATPAQTSPLTAGPYAWTYSASAADGSRYTLGQGRVTLLADVSAVAAAGYDGRSTAQKALDDAESALANFKASGGRVRAYTIAGRSITFADEAALLSVISYWRLRVRTELHAARTAAGLGDPSRLLVRFNSP